MGLQKRLAYFLLIIPSFILPVSAEVIETFVCQSCSESQARDLATTKFDQPSCQFGDLGGGPAVIDETPMYCDVTNKDVIIIDPQNKTTRKYRVTASYPQQYIIQINSTPVGVSSDELSAAEIFYNFYDDVLIATSGGNLEVSYEDFLSVQGISVPGNSVLTGNNSDPASCAAVSQYMKNRITQSDTQDFVRRELAEHLNGVNVNDIGEDEDLTGLNVQLGRNTVALGVTWESSQIPLIATLGDDDNRLVFDLSFKGTLELGDVSQVHIGLKLDRHLSRIDGLSFQNAFPDGVNNEAYNTTTADHQCLRDLVQEIAEQFSWGVYIGDGMESSNEVTRSTRNGSFFCVRNVSYKTCSSDEDALTCTSSTYSFPVACPVN
jgi:hypothetical protein